MSTAPTEERPVAPTATQGRCAAPKATQKVANPGTGPIAWCPGCRSWRPAAQVPWGQEARDQWGGITATFAPVAH